MRNQSRCRETEKRDDRVDGERRGRAALMGGLLWLQLCGWGGVVLLRGWDTRRGPDVGDLQLHFTHIKMEMLLR